MRLKESTKKILIADSVKLLLAWAGGTLAFTLLFICLDFGTAVSIGLGILCGFLLSSIPFGWRWVSTFFTADSLLPVVIKGIMSVSLGWIALPIIILKDIFHYINSDKT